jgi:protein-S-isoprenylcysteine O-methyltransferase Ste14
MIFGGIFGGLYIDDILFNSVKNNTIFRLISLIIGIFIIFIVIRISKNTGKTLAKYGRKGNIKRMETNILVTKGIYSYMRHPMHLGLLLFPLSFAFIIASPSFILIIAPIEIIFILIMIKLVEEPEAVKKFGKDYTVYKNKIPWFCLKIRCIKELLKKQI